MANITKLRKAKRETQKNHGRMQVEDLIKNISAEKLREFITAQSKNNPELFNAVCLEFADGKENKKSSAYHTLLRNALASVDLDEEDYYLEEFRTIDIMDDLLDKAKNCVKNGQYDKAILICKACIEEYSSWLDESDISYGFCPEYKSIPFEILEAAAKHTDKKELFDYCILEMKKKKYTKIYCEDYFHDLLASLAIGVDPDAFIALQDKLLEGIKGKDDYKAEKILRRKVDFFRQIKQLDNARAILERNMQIDSFRMEIVQWKIKEKSFSEAKKIIADYFKKNTGKAANPFSYYYDEWNKLLLEIALKEKDIPAVRNLAYGLIEHGFEEKIFVVYKAAFSPAEWPAKREELLAHYSRGKSFNYSAAEFLKTENDVEGLLSYMEKHISLREIEDYYKIFVSAYPEKTIALFVKAINLYAAENTGRSYYEYIVSMLKKLIKIKGGKEAARGLVEDFKIHYKTRRAMVEILNRFQKKSL